MDFLDKLNNLNINIYLDGADLNSMMSYSSHHRINGFTSNPSLMYQNNISNYKDFIIDSLKIVNNKPISFEVVSDEIDEIFEQAKRIYEFGKNIFVKIPITTTNGVSCIPIIKKLTDLEVPLNITAIMSSSQALDLINFIGEPKNTIILSIFAGRIADTGIDPKVAFTDVMKVSNNYNNYDLLWASPREIYNMYEANDIGVDIITITPQILKKASLFKKNLEEYSLETVKMFYEDAKKNNLDI